MEKKNKEPKGRYKYYADYPFKDVVNKKGKVKRKRVYDREYYGYEIPKEYEGNEKTFVNRIKIFYSIIILFSIGLWLFSSMIQPTMYSVYYVLPGFLAAGLSIALILFTCGEFILFTRNNKFERSFANDLSKGLRTKTIALMVSSVICFVTATISILVNYFQNNIAHKLLNNVASALAMLGIVLVCWFFLKLQDSLKISAIEKK